ncbi:vitamin K epoxide reductase family protein [Microbacterium sp. CJ88]|uniref:vitamin K epoxide reductase family protein n=1 Tax=Microbacterium sp. CJ88 TaxID=3445672 RepID=UPI003F6596D0
MPSSPSHTRPTVLAVWLVIAGVIGWSAAFALTLEKLHALANPGAGASCDFSVLVQCSANLESAQGSVFGFPNPLIGLGAWTAPIVVGMAILAGARFARWFWVLFWAGMLFAFCFVCWLIGQSIFVLGTLCPWCMVTWAVTIPTFYAVTLHLLRSGVVPALAGLRSAANRLMAWVPLLAILSYAVIVLLAQVRLDALTNIFGG